MAPESQIRLFTDLGREKGRDLPPPPILKPSKREENADPSTRVCAAESSRDGELGSAFPPLHNNISHPSRFRSQLMRNT
ncbi:hypothetical protein Y1Q_0008350 [Alligator mississippiensis]|uniref:Uncharacterized protein n=1 Tax=Alligator mississippiensis TaxID=8496 RepID=A0A151N1Z7_ALLMI|nr:hypothetical protein Y1Q_0008350 [Alligator mississippiensis]